MDKTLQRLKTAVENARNIALILHVSPDGDTCGSALALCRAFVLQGKSVAVLCDDPIPQLYSDFPGVEMAVTPEMVKSPDPFDLAIAVDVADRERLGRCSHAFDAARLTAQIDHHMTNPGYARINFVRSPLSATGVLAWELMGAMGISMDEPIARCLYAAVATDTGNFKQQNTDSEALRLAARCVEGGLDIQPVALRLFDERPFCQGRLLGHALCSLTQYAQGRIVMMRLTAEDFVNSGALPEHTEGIVNFAIHTEGAKIACLLSQVGEDRVKCSLRALPPYAVSDIAIALNGGGHELAAGCTLSMPLDDAYKTLRDAMVEEAERTR